MFKAQFAASHLKLQNRWISIGICVIFAFPTCVLTQWISIFFIIERIILTFDEKILMLLKPMVGTIFLQKPEALK